MSTLGNGGDTVPWSVCVLQQQYNNSLRPQSTPSYHRYLLAALFFSRQGVYFAGASDYGEIIGRQFALTFEIVDVPVARKRMGDTGRGESSERQTGAKTYQVSRQAERAANRGICWSCWNSGWNFFFLFVAKFPRHLQLGSTRRDT